jgi:hypothetical protein
VMSILTSSLECHWVIFPACFLYSCAGGKFKHSQLFFRKVANAEREVPGVRKVNGLEDDAFTAYMTLSEGPILCRCPLSVLIYSARLLQSDAIWSRYEADIPSVRRCLLMIVSCVPSSTVLLRE